MNPGDDKSLQEALAKWKVAAPLPPRFQDNVWRRIERAEAARAESFGQLCQAWVERLFGRPAFALSYVAVLLFFGLTAGYWHGRVDRRQVNTQLAERYVQTVSPYRDIQ